MDRKERTLQANMRRGLSALALLCLTTSLPLMAQAQDADAVTDAPVEKLESTDTSVPTEGLSFNLPATPEFGAQSGPEIDLPLNMLPRDTLGSTLFKLDLSASDCAGTGENCLRRSNKMDLGLTDTFRKRSEKGLDLSLTPRATMRFDDEVSSAAVGAVIEIGEDLRQGSEFENNTWYFFAGADAEALTYSPTSVGRITSGEFHLQDRIIVGDAQAGLGYRIGDADLSVSYMRREASTEEFKFVEDAATLSFTWKR